MFRGVLDLLIPSCCVGCDEPGEALCARCRRGMRPRLVQRSTGPPMYALAEYDGAARRAVIAYKERGRRELAVFFGMLIAAALPMLPGSSVRRLVPVPSRRAAVRRRGGQHMRLVAEHTGAEVLPVLRVDRRVRDSVGLDLAERAGNLAGRITARGLRPGTEVVLVDDVITTGATAHACCSALAATGAEVKAVLALTAT